MTINNINPYLDLGGNAEKAIRLYETALGAKTECVMRFADAPQCNVPEEAKNAVMHAQLRVGPCVLMLSDGRMDQPARTAGNVTVNLDFADPAEMTRAFEMLADGGSVTVALHDAFWGSKFGMVVDPYGIHWMMNCAQKKD